MRGVVAVTGATGFIGRQLVPRLVGEGWSVRALCRDHGRAPSGAEVVVGALEDGASVRRLVEGSRTVVHLAGLVRARSRSEFERANAEGTARLAAAAVESHPRPRVLLVSSLAAREPGLSAYADSKRRGEEAAARVLGRGAELRIVRPPAVYGPGDRATLPIFRMLRHGFLVVPAGGDARFSLLFVDDLVDLLRTLVARSEWSDDISEPDDGRPGGYGWAELAEIAGRQLGHRVRVIGVTRAVARSVAAIDQSLAGLLRRPPVLGVDKVREMFHQDWVSRGAEVASCTGSRTRFDVGVTRTMAWYEDRGWL